MNGDETALERQWRFLRLLAHRRQGATLNELALEAGVTSRTVRRDLEMFRRIGFPLLEQTAEFGRKTWRLEPISLAALTFTPDEALSFYLGRRFLDPLAGTVPGDAAQRVFEKVRECLGPAALQFLDRLADKFLLRTPGVSDYSSQSLLLDDLFHSIAERRAARVAYHSSRSAEPVSYELHPYGLVWHKGAIYLLAYSPFHESVRTFKVNRIQSAEMTARRFEKDPRFNARTYLSSAFGIMSGPDDHLVRIRFAPAVARYVAEGTWHSSQTLSPQSDGGVIMELRLSNLEEVHKWVMSFGATCEVLEPEALRERVREEARRTLALYSEPSASVARERQVSGRVDGVKRNAACLISS